MERRTLDCDCDNAKFLPLWSNLIVGGQTSAACYCGYCGRLVSRNRENRDRRVNGDRRVSERRRVAVALVS